MQPMKQRQRIEHTNPTTSLWRNSSRPHWITQKPTTAQTWLPPQVQVQILNCFSPSGDFLSTPFLSNKTNTHSSDSSFKSSNPFPISCFCLATPVFFSVVIWNISYVFCHPPQCFLSSKKHTPKPRRTAAHRTPTKKNQPDHDRESQCYHSKLPSLPRSFCPLRRCLENSDTTGSSESSVLTLGLQGGCLRIVPYRNSKFSKYDIEPKKALQTHHVLDLFFRKVEHRYQHPTNTPPRPIVSTNMFFLVHFQSDLRSPSCKDVEEVVEARGRRWSLVPVAMVFRSPTRPAKT